MVIGCFYGGQLYQESLFYLRLTLKGWALGHPYFDYLNAGLLMKYTFSFDIRTGL